MKRQRSTTLRLFLCPSPAEVTCPPSFRFKDGRPAAAGRRAPWFSKIYFQRAKAVAQPAETDFQCIIPRLLSFRILPKEFFPQGMETQGQLLAFRTQLWSFRTQLWAFRTQLWVFRTQLWAFRIQLWAFRTQLWSAKVGLLAAKVKFRKAKVENMTNNQQSILNSKIQWQTSALQFQPIPMN